MTKKRLEELRSQRTFGASDLRSFGHRSRALQMGYAREDFLNKPVVAIINTWSDLAQCHSHFPERVEDIKRGVWQAGGFPVELPAMSLSEQFVKPTSMLYRNFLAMETEELLRQHPVDGVVLMGGCDKTTPGLVMGAISDQELPVALEAGAELVAWSERFVAELMGAAAARAGAPVRVHVKLDTGMGRLGTRDAGEALRITELGLQMKSEIEKCREQVQNLE